MEIKVDFDACEERWKYYQIRYRDFGISLEDVIFPGKDKSARGKWKFRSIVLSGDCFFNFNEKKVETFIQDEYLLTEGPFTYMNPSSSQKRFGLVEYKCIFVDEIELQPWKNYRTEGYTNKKGNIGYRLESKSKTPSWWSDYNKVKHHRTSSIGKEETLTNYSKANLGNLTNAFSALYILERAFMDMVGKRDDLSCFMDHSSLFVKPRQYTMDEMDELFAIDAVTSRVR